jgi:hypothetical protein
MAGSGKVADSVPQLVRSMNVPQTRIRQESIERKVQVLAKQLDQGSSGPVSVEESANGGAVQRGTCLHSFFWTPFFTPLGAIKKGKKMNLMRWAAFWDRVRQHLVGGGEQLPEVTVFRGGQTQKLESATAAIVNHEPTTGWYRVRVSVILGRSPSCSIDYRIRPNPPLGAAMAFFRQHYVGEMVDVLRDKIGLSTPPWTRLPPVLVDMVWSFLDAEQTAQCLQTCKAWQAVLLTDRSRNFRARLRNDGSCPIPARWRMFVHQVHHTEHVDETLFSKMNLAALAQFGAVRLLRGPAHFLPASLSATSLQTVDIPNLLPDDWDPSLLPFSLTSLSLQMPVVYWRFSMAWYQASWIAIWTAVRRLTNLTHLSLRGNSGWIPQRDPRVPGFYLPPHLTSLVLFAPLDTLATGQKLPSLTSLHGDWAITPLLAHPNLTRLGLEFPIGSCASADVRLTARELVHLAKIVELHTNATHLLPHFSRLERIVLSLGQVGGLDQLAKHPCKATLRSLVLESSTRIRHALSVCADMGSLETLCLSQTKRVGTGWCPDKAWVKRDGKGWRAEGGWIHVSEDKADLDGWLVFPADRLVHLHTLQLRMPYRLRSPRLLVHMRHLVSITISEDADKQALCQLVSPSWHPSILQLECDTL